MFLIENGEMVAGLVRYQHLVADTFITRPDARLPQSHAGGQGLYFWSLNHLGRRSEAKDRKNKIDKENKR